MWCVKSFYLCSVDFFWCLLLCFYSFVFSSCYFSNSVRILRREGCIYFLIYAFVTIQMFEAASLAAILDNQLVSTGFVLIVCEVKC